MLGGELEPTAGAVERGATVRLAQLSQDTAEIPGDLRVLESLEAVQRRARRSATGTRSPPSLLCDRFGFRGDARAHARRATSPAASAGGCS